MTYWSLGTITVAGICSITATLKTRAVAAAIGRGGGDAVTAGMGLGFILGAYLLLAVAVLGAGQGALQTGVCLRGSEQPPRTHVARKLSCVPRCRSFA